MNRHVDGMIALLACLALAGCGASDGCPECGTGERCLDGSCLLSPPACGTAPAEGCDSYLPEADCAAGGGRWTINPGGQGFCNCISGDAGCPCWASTDCNGLCLADYDGTCDETVIGACSETLAVFGCVCTIMSVTRPEHFEKMCID